MAKYEYATASDIPVRMELTVYEMRTICAILQREVEAKGADRWFASTLHGELVEAIGKAGQSMKLEAEHIGSFLTQHLTDQLSEAQQRADQIPAE